MSLCLPCAQERIKCFGTWWYLREPLLFVTSEQHDLERVRYIGGNLGLQGKDVIKVAIEGLRPQVIAGDCADELCSDANSFADFAHTAFKHCTDIEFAAYRRDIHGECP